jgi:hypothetical protein
MTYTWTTEKGAKVSMTVNKVADKKELDGLEYTDKAELKITNLTVNGTEFDAKFGRCSQLGLALFKAGKQDAGVKIPEDIYNSIYAEQRAATKASFASAREYEEHVAAVYRAMNK